jgi:hypothetical protein
VTSCAKFRRRSARSDSRSTARIQAVPGGDANFLAALRPDGPRTRAVADDRAKGRHLEPAEESLSPFAGHSPRNIPRLVSRGPVGRPPQGRLPGIDGESRHRLHGCAALRSRIGSARRSGPSTNGSCGWRSRGSSSTHARHDCADSRPEGRGRIQPGVLAQGDPKEIPVHRGFHVRIDGGVRTGRDCICVDEVGAGKKLGVVQSAHS